MITIIAMNNTGMKHIHPERGIALLITLLLITVLMGVSASLLNVTLKQYQFSNIGLASEMAFQAASAGMECILYHDNGAPTFPLSRFDVNDNNTGVAPELGVSCMGDSSDDLERGNATASIPPGITAHANLVDSGEEQRFRFSWSTGVSGVPEVCSEVSIYKFSSGSIMQEMDVALGRPNNDCAVGVICTVIRARGYNVACPNNGAAFPLRTLEREFTQRY